MPSGVYERKPFMKTWGKLSPHRSEIEALRREGVTIRQIAERYSSTSSSVSRLLNGRWNAHRRSKSGSGAKRVT